MKEKKNYFSSVSLLLQPYGLLVPKLFLHSTGVFTGLPNVFWLQPCFLDRPTGPSPLAFVEWFLDWEHLRALLSCLTGQPSCTPAPCLAETSHMLPLCRPCLPWEVSSGWGWHGHSSPCPGTLQLSPQACWSVRCSPEGPGQILAALRPPCAVGKD